VVSHHPIFLDRIQTGETSGSFGFVFKQFLPHRGWFDISIPAISLFGPRGLGELSDRGANIRDSKLFFAYTRDAADLWHQNHKTEMTYEQYGWKENDTSFLLGDTLYTARGKMPATGSSEMHTRSQWVGPTQKGSLEKWRDAANSLFAVDCEGQSVAVCAGFAAPLMKFLSPTEGGAILSYVSPDTAKGKTTAALGAITIWGQQKGLEVKTEFSKVVRGLTFAAIGNLPVMNDELRARDPVVMRDYVLMFTGGGDKPRGSRDGSIRHMAATWQNILITTDNFSLVDLLAIESEVEDAAQMRVIELPCSIPQGKGHIYGDKLKRQLQENAGWAGDTYLSWLVVPENLAWTKAQLEKATQAIYVSTGWDERHRFWVRTVAACAVGGKIASALGLVDFNVTRVIKWLIAQLGERMKPKEQDWEVPLLSTYIDQHHGERIIVAGRYQPHEKAVMWEKPSSGRLSIRLESDRQRYFIVLGALRDWATKQGRSYKAMMDKLVSMKVVVNRRCRITLGAGTVYAGGQVWAMEIDGQHPAMSGIPRVVAPASPADEDVPHQLRSATTPQDGRTA
jgi:hypothetical protein